MFRQLSLCPMMIAFIDDKQPVFPQPNIQTLREDGLIAVSQNITASMIINAYQNGIFPWYSDEQFVYWFATHPRFVLRPQWLKISRSLGKTLRNKPYRITLNQAFNQVIRSCANTKRPNQNGTWISPDFQAAYCALHHLGFAHSFECWLPENDKWQLAGGFYGVKIGSVFYGESMFAHIKDASKIAFACAVPFLQQAGIQLIDCQQKTEHLARFGAKEMNLQVFINELHQLNTQTIQNSFAPQIIVHHTV